MGESLRVDPPTEFRNARPRAEELDASDLTLAGLMKDERGWSAYACRPWRNVVLLHEGQSLFRGKMTSVGSGGVTIVGAGGTVELRLAK